MHNLSNDGMNLPLSVVPPFWVRVVFAMKCPGYEMSEARVVKGTGGFKSSWVRVVLGTSCPGYKLSRVRVVKGTSYFGYELSWMQLVLGKSSRYYVDQYNPLRIKMNKMIMTL